MQQNQQPKISSFFKPRPTTFYSIKTQPSSPPHPTTLITYKRRHSGGGGDGVSDNGSRPDCDRYSSIHTAISSNTLRVLTNFFQSHVCSDGVCDNGSRTDVKGVDRTSSVGKVVNRKRSYAQYHLELGQSDFLLHMCGVCGMMYARGDEKDETVHKVFHRNYYQGIPFKGWRHERVVSTPGGDGDRVLLVLDGDPPAQKNKVKEVIKVMEKELGFSDDQLLHKLCKVYLFVSRQRIVGCLVAEPIRRAHKVVFSTSSSYSSNDTSRKPVARKLRADCEGSRRLNQTIKFGAFNFQREVVKINSSTNKAKVDEWDSGAILCEEEAVPAVCGIRAIWVVPSNRRKRIASKLMDTTRSSFRTGQLLEPSQYAFTRANIFREGICLQI